MRLSTERAVLSQSHTASVVNGKRNLNNWAAESLCRTAKPHGRPRYINNKNSKSNDDCNYYCPILSTCLMPRALSSTFCELSLFVTAIVRGWYEHASLVLILRRFFKICPFHRWEHWSSERGNTSAEVTHRVREETVPVLWCGSASTLSSCEVGHYLI